MNLLSAAFGMERVKSGVMGRPMLQENARVVGLDSPNMVGGG